MKFSIIVPFYNGLNYVNRLFETLDDYLNKPDCEVIIVDDCSNEETFIFFTNRTSKIDNETFQKLSELYYMGVALLIPVALLGTNPSGPQRIISYFSWSLIIILPFVIKKFHSMFISFLFILLCMIYYYLTVSAFGDLIPYKFNPNLRLI